jgi:hypothetical protein
MVIAGIKLCMEALQDQVPIAGALVMVCSANSQRQLPAGDAIMKFATPV